MESKNNLILYRIDFKQNQIHEIIIQILSILNRILTILARNNLN